MSSIMKSKIRIALCVISLVCCIMIISFSVAYLTSLTESEVIYTVGTVDVDLEIYFVDDAGNPLATEDEDGNPINTFNYVCEYADGNSAIKSGVIKVNISDNDALNFAEKLRVDLVVKSNVDTYVRIAPYEQLTLTYTVNGVTREVAVVQEESTKFNYQFAETAKSFYDNRDKDGYIYFRSAVKKNEEQNRYPLISAFTTAGTFEKSDQIYSLQIGFIVESVQKIQGLEKNWGITSLPGEIVEAG